MIQTYAILSLLYLYHSLTHKFEGIFFDYIFRSGSTKEKINAHFKMCTFWPIALQKKFPRFYLHQHSACFGFAGA